MLFPNEAEDTLSGGERIMKPTTSRYMISPNPVIEQLQISYKKESGTDAEFVLIDIAGRVIMEVNLADDSGFTSIDLGHVLPGMYLYRITERGLLKAGGKLSKQ